MSKQLSIGFAIFIGCCSVSLNAQVSAPITSVVVSPNGAVVVRAAKVERGKSQVRAPSLPESVEQAAVYVEPGPGIRVMAVRVDPTTLSSSDSDAQKKKIDERAALQAKLRAADQVREYLRQQASASGKAPADAKTISATAEAIWNESQKVSDTTQATEAKIRALDTDLQKLAAAGRKKVITVDVDAGEAGQVLIQYTTAQAGWKRAYRANLEASATKLKLESTAEISQRTGEDWSNVTAVLSSEGPRLPLRGPQPAPRKVSVLSLDSTVSGKTVPAPGQAAAKIEIPADSPNIRLDAPLSLPSGQAVRASIRTDMVDVTQSLRIVPRQDTVATMLVQGKRPADVRLPGDLQLYRDGGLVGKPYAWNPVADGVAFEFGKDPRLQGSVTRTKDPDGAKKDGTVVRVSELITLRNSTTQDLRALVIDSALTNDQPKVKLERSFDPKPATEAWNGRKDMIAWEQSVPAAKEVQLKASYVITYPQAPAASTAKPAAAKAGAKP